MLEVFIDIGNYRQYYSEGVLYFCGFMWLKTRVWRLKVLVCAFSPIGRICRTSSILMPPKEAEIKLCQDVGIMV